MIWSSLRITHSQIELDQKNGLIEWTNSAAMPNRILGRNRFVAFLAPYADLAKWDSLSLLYPLSQRNWRSPSSRRRLSAEDGLQSNRRLLIESAGDEICWNRSNRLGVAYSSLATVFTDLRCVTVVCNTLSIVQYIRLAPAGTVVCLLEPGIQFSNYRQWDELSIR